MKPTILTLLLLATLALAIPPNYKQLNLTNRHERSRIEAIFNVYTFPKEVAARMGLNRFDVRSYRVETAYELIINKSEQEYYSNMTMTVGKKTGRYEVKYFCSQSGRGNICYIYNKDGIRKLPVLIGMF